MNTQQEPMKAADALFKAKLLSDGQYEAIKKAVAITGDRAEEVMIINGLMSEADLLKVMSGLYKTKFVSSEKLAKAEIARATLEMVPHKVAETFQICPVMFDAKTGVLSVVTADPDNTDLMKEVQLVSGAQKVQAFLARPSAVRAAIGKHHGRNANAFDALERERYTAKLSALEPGLGLGSQSWVADLANPPAPGTGPGTAAPKGAAAAGATSPKAAAKAEGGFLDMPPVPTLEAPGAPGALQAPPSSASMPVGRGVSSGAEPPTKQMPIVPTAEAVAIDATADVAGVLVSLLETSRPDLKGHSQHVAKLTRRVCERLGLDALETSAIVLAGHLHDLGKMAQFHLTPLNVADYDGHKVAAEKAVDTPSRLMESVKLHDATVSAVSQMYERWNGEGFPAKLSGKDISIGARVLAVADTYADLTQNPRNPYRKQLDAADACAVLTRQREKIFDPHVVDTFKAIVLGDDLKSRLIATRKRALLIDADQEETTVLELRLIEQGFEVHAARTLESARKLLPKNDFDVVISEMTFPDGTGLDLLSEARTATWGKDVTWVILTSSQDRTAAQKAFELGAVDFVSKPAMAEVFVAKIRALTDNRRPKAATSSKAGVSGSLSEMSLADIIQVLFHGRKTGRLVIKGSSNGEIHFQSGDLVDAAMGGKRGLEAFYALMRLREGEFAFDPSFAPTKRLIHETSESLLLEAMRRMDENI